MEIDWKKKYEEELNKARELHGTVAAGRDFLAEIFPELAESENEMIRSALLRGFNSMLANQPIGTFYGEPIKDIIAYLEKQRDFQSKVQRRMEHLWDKLPDSDKVENGDCTPEEWKALGAYMELEMNFDNGSEEKQKEQKPPIAGNDFGWIDELKHDLEHPEELDQKVDDVLKQRRGIKDLEWSEEDRLHYANVLEALEYVKGCKSDYDKIEAVKSDIAWFKSLRTQPKDECGKTTINGEPVPTENHSVNIPLPEWSKEDKKIAETICKEGDLKPSEKRWLKSLPERFNLQPKQEWSEDNIKELTKFEVAILHIGMSFFGSSAGLNPNNTNEVKRQAKLLLELVPKQEWSEEDIKKIRSEEYTKGFNDAAFGGKLKEWCEEDEKMLTDISWAIRHCAYDNKKKERVMKWFNDDYRKFLRPQPYKEVYQAAKHDLAIKFMNYLDENRPEGKMCLSNGECEDIDKAFKENDWAKIMRYVEKYRPHWKPSDEHKQ